MKRRLYWFSVLLVLTLLLSTFGGARLAQAAPPADEEVDAQIANAESAGTRVVAQDATIMGWDADGLPTIVLRTGTNGWTCLTDWPASPGNDPACYDAVFNAWNKALMMGKEAPGVDGTGIAYMLAGGSDPSNTDPFAMEPAAGEAWISTPPHIMLVTEAGFDAADYASEPKQDEPYIMWDDTPYEHLMIPVVSTPDDLMGDVDEEMANILRAAPASVALNATIMGNPEKEGDPMVVVKEGTNGWVCYPDGAVSPGNDPSCNDPMMEAFWSIGDTEGVTKVGLSYMLQGGSDASNTDPNLSSPPEGEDWVSTPPHVMVVVPGGFDTAQSSTNHMSGYPYIMFADTGYQHIMIPVADLPEMGMGAMQDAAVLDDEALQTVIMDAEFTTWDHLMAHDVAATKAEIAEDFIMIGADGDRLGREDLLAVVGDSSLTFDEPVHDNVVVRRLGPDTAIIIYVNEFTGSHNGEAFAGEEETTSIWQMRAGRWQNIFLQSTRLANAEATASGSDAAIANAESAAPTVVAQDATIMDWDTDGMPTVLLREGTNDWTCLTDWPASPGNDPECFDPVWTAWNEAYMAGKEPKISGPGIAYMLQGGSDPSNTDPFATEPAAGEAWISTPPHVMILAPDGFNASQFASEPSQTEPYIMWDGTPYEHLMQPVLPMTEAVQIPEIDDPAVQELIAAEQQLNYAADFLHDVDTAKQMLANEYQEASSGSRLVKTEKLAWIKSGVYLGQKAVFSDVTVEFDGDHATIHFTATFTGIYEGKPYHGDPSPVTNVWVKRDGRWQMAKGG